MFDKDEFTPLGKILVPIRVDGESKPPRVYDLVMSKGRYCLVIGKIQHPVHGEGLHTLWIEKEHVHQSLVRGAPWTYRIPIDVASTPESGLQ